MTVKKNSKAKNKVVLVQNRGRLEGEEFTLTVNSDERDFIIRHAENITFDDNTNTFRLRAGNGIKKRTTLQRALWKAANPKRKMPARISREDAYDFRVDKFNQ
jgi:hypothetical protein